MIRLGVRARLRALGLYPKIPDQPGIVAAFSRWSWAAWSMRADSGPISRTGLATEPLSPQWAQRFLSELDAAPQDPIRVDDRKPWYFNEARQRKWFTSTM
jgi:hypothetical protein